MRILLHDAVAVARDPDVVLVIDEAAVKADEENIPVAPRVPRKLPSLSRIPSRAPTGPKTSVSGGVDQVSAIDSEGVVPCESMQTHATSPCCHGRASPSPY